MATVLERPSATHAHHDVDDFLSELTQLCQRHGVGLTNGAALFLMESEDFSRAFSVNDESELSFA